VIAVRSGRLGARAAFAFAAGAALVAAAGATPQIAQQAKFTASDVATRDYFGAAVALSGDTSVVGAFNKNGDQGAAYVFVRGVAEWTQQARLVAGDAAPDDNFGVTVAVAGDTALAGADAKNHAQGAAYVFVRQDGAWTQQAKLGASDGSYGDYFGSALALSGDTAVVGAFNKNAARGAAYVFIRQDGAWTQQAKLVADDGADESAFGAAVALDGDTVVVGAFGPNGGAGGAYVFTRTATTWTLSAKVAADDGQSGDAFGGAVAVRGDTIAVGAFAQAGIGAAYMFARDGLGAWTLAKKLTAAGGASRDYFGTSICLDGDTVAVGADYRDGARGGAYVFKRVEGAWAQAALLSADDAVVDDHLGYGLALDAGTVIAGAYGRDNVRGAAYVFTGIPAPPPPDPGPGDGGGGGNPPPPVLGIASASPMQLSVGASIVVTGTGFSTKPRAWLELNGRRIALKVARGAAVWRFTARLTSIPRNFNGACTLNVLPRGAKTPYVLDGMSIELPNIVAVAPAASDSDAQATILGAFFGTRRGLVRLEGRRCRIRAWKDTEITVRVPRTIARGDAVDVEVDNVVGGALTFDAFTR
jgi:hypothetical protein